MGRRIVYCEACGVRLCEDDFSIGKAKGEIKVIYDFKPTNFWAAVVEEPARRALRYRWRGGLPLRRPPATI